MKRTQKQRHEETFHDHYAKTLGVDDITVFTKPSAGYQELQKTEHIFGTVQGKKILDLGCGCGETAVFWARKGAQVEAIDISRGMIALTKKLTRKYGVTRNCHAKQMTAENLTFKSNSFDYIFGDGILHHVDLEQTLNQIHRVLKKGGFAVFIEPLAYNPIINVYRDIATTVRTTYERPITFTEIGKMTTVFRNVTHEEYHLFTLIVFIFFYLSGINPNKHRYWKKFRDVDGLLGKILLFLSYCDRVFLKLIPPARYLCWNTVIIIQK